ncbi:MAG TPA: glycosyltransferase family 2 protein, partial [Streptosporangiaceae bacterium]
YYSYKYFFAVSQPSRNERNGAIFAGTMGLIRRSALGQAGGWDEWCITEDAELSLRLLAGGWGGLHVDQSWGEGIMPLTFEALKGQRYRWCFGGIQILRMHWRSLLPGRRTSSNRLTAAQRWTYLAGALQWYGDLLGLAFYFFLLAGAVNLADGGGQLFRKLTPFLVATVPALVALGLVRAMALLRRGTGASWRDAIGAFFVWQSTSLVVARASIKGLFSRRAAFLRTPKTGENAGFWQALRANWAETSLALLGIGGIAGALTRLGTPGAMSGALLAALLIVPTFGLAAAPVNSVAAQRAALPADLRQRRRTESLRERRVVAGSAVAASGAVASLAAFGVVLVLLLVPGRAASPPNPLRPGSGSGASGPAAPAPDPVRKAPGSGAARSGSPRPSAPPDAAEDAGVAGRLRQQQAVRLAFAHRVAALIGPGHPAVGLDIGGQERAHGTRLRCGVTHAATARAASQGGPRTRARAGISVPAVTLPCLRAGTFRCMSVRYQPRHP